MNGLQRRLVGTRIDYGWLIVFACFLLTSLTFGTVYSFNVFFGEIVAEFETSTAAGSLVFALQSIVTYGAACVVGLLIDRYGVRRLATLGTGLVFIGLIGVSQLTSFVGVLVSYGIVAALGFSITMVIGFVLPAKWFDERQGLATGVATSGTGFGILLLPRISSELIDAFGWRQAYIVILAPLVALLALSTILLTDRRLTSSNGGPQEASPATDEASTTEQIAAVKRVAVTSRFRMTFLGFLLLYTPVYVVLVYVVELAESLALGSAVGVAAVSSIGGANIIGKLVSGSLSDWSGLIPVLGLCGVFISLSTVALPFATTRTWMVVLAVGFGLGYGGSGALVSPLVANNYSIANANAVFGIIMASFAVSGSLMPYLAGLSHDLFGTYVLAFVTSGVVGLCGVFLILHANYLN